MVLLVSTYVTHQMSMVFLYSALDAKNQTIAIQQETIKNLIKENEINHIVIDNAREVIKEGLKSGCLTHDDAKD